MIEFKKIICATDFSEPSLKAVDYAGILAARFGMELTLVNVVDFAHLGVAPTSVATEASTLNLEAHQSSLKEDAVKRLDELATEHKSPGFTIRKQVLEGKPSEEIVNLARENSVDLIVIATHGHSPLHRFVFGSVAERVVHSAPCPVLTIGPED